MLTDTRAIMYALYLCQIAIYFDEDKIFHTRCRAVEFRPRIEARGGWVAELDACLDALRMWCVSHFEAPDAQILLALWI